jgi:ribosomal peptide maturation radical SAM protein 1
MSARPEAGPETTTATRSADVVFVVMPFADIGRPAIGVSLLQAAAKEAGHTAAVEYCNIDFADRIGADLYATISSGLAPDMLVGEWVFAGDVFGDRVAPPEEYVEQVLSRAVTPDLARRIDGARAARDVYLDDCAARVMARKPRVVGFTTTFHQTCASLAVARRLKALPDPPVVVFGGANCEGEMGLQLLQSFPWIDYVCCGEADLTFPKLLDGLLAREPRRVVGVLGRDGAREPQASAPVFDLDSLPYPDYHDYFDALNASSESRGAAVHVVVETSRGCWWGAKHHCTFCGLNGDTMAFRSKSPERAFAEITTLAERHGLAKVGCVDNILDMSYVDTLFPMLAESGLELEMFYEVKANLRHDQLSKMHAGGIRQIQPGIESFSDQVLKLMDKGVSGLQNIQLMRWCDELGIDCAWNLLAGFPSEEPAEYARMADLIPLLAHLEPPMSCARLRLDRFSPFHARAEEFGFRRMRPSRAYFYVFPLGRREMGRLAYFFDFDYDDGRRPEEYLAPVQRAVQNWWEARMSGDSRPRLDAELEGDAIAVTDTRRVAVAEHHRLEGVAARVLELCDRMKSYGSLVRRPELAGAGGEVRAALDDLVARRLVLDDDGRYLSLPVFRNRARPDGRDGAYAGLEATAAA